MKQTAEIDRRRQRSRYACRSGQSLVEYTLIIVFVFLVCIGILKAIGPRVNNLLADSNEKIANAN